MKFIFNNERPIYLQLVEQLQLYIISGKIPPGEKLPSVRELAIQAKVNPNTMQRALAELESQKLIFTERTNGKYVTNNIRQIDKYKHRLVRTVAKNFLQNLKEIGCSKAEVIEILKIMEEQ